MFPVVIPNNNSTFLAGSRFEDFGCTKAVVSTAVSPHLDHPENKIKKKRSLPGHPDPDADVIALSPKTLLATNRYVCEICNKGFQREQNLQLHRRGHNLPWKLKRKSGGREAKKRAYVCPEPSCVHHEPSRALGDLTGIRKHFCRKHGEKKWKCHKCSKLYAVHSDWKAHSKICGTRQYTCDCGTIFSRKDSFITHRAFCDALAEESARLWAAAAAGRNPIDHLSSPPAKPSPSPVFPLTNHPSLPSWDPPQNPNPNVNPLGYNIKPRAHCFSPLFQESNAAMVDPVSAHLSTTALNHKTAAVGATDSLGLAGRPSQALDDSLDNVVRTELMCFTAADLVSWEENERLTRNFWV